MRQRHRRRHRCQLVVVGGQPALVGLRGRELTGDDGDGDVPRHREVDVHRRRRTGSRVRARQRVHADREQAGVDLDARDIGGRGQVEREQRVEDRVDIRAARIGLHAQRCRRPPLAEATEQAGERRPAERGEEAVGVVEGVERTGDRVSIAVTWRATGGSITAQEPYGAHARYTAPSAPGDYTVIASFSGLADTALVHVQP